MCSGLVASLFVLTLVLTGFSVYALRSLLYDQYGGKLTDAAEVRKLAEQSSSAASKISTLIGEVQRRTDEAVASMKEGNEITVTSVQAVHEAGDVFGKIAGQIEMLSGHIEESVRAIRQAGEGGRQIVEAVNEIEKVADQLASETQNVSAAGEEQSATIEEIAAAASQLSHMADELKDIVRKFRLA